MFSLRNLLLGLLLLAAWPVSPVRAQWLFDATKAEMAGSADWVLDADAHNLKVSTSGDGSGTLGTGGNDSNPQRVPTPAASGITASTSETYWDGALSAWGVGLVKQNLPASTVIETLPVFIPGSTTVKSRITYGDGTNAQDLSNYHVFVLIEPNILFTTAEKTAIITFVKNGGSLFICSDHTGADRNNDGSDAVQVLNDLMTNNSVLADPFGFQYNGDDISPSGVADTTASDPLTHGVAGTVSTLVYSDGSSMSITATNAHAAVWETSSKSSSQVMALYGTFGAGKFVAMGDSSPIDDGTGDPNDSLYNGWSGDSVDDGDLVLNASAWLQTSSVAAPTVTTGTATSVTGTSALLSGTINPNGQSASYLFQSGTSTAYGSNTSSQAAGSGTAAVVVSASISGLNSNTTYHFRLSGSSAGGSVNGSDVTFTTLRAPSVTTGTASVQSGVVALLSGTINPNGQSTVYLFQSGTSTSYGLNTSSQAAGSGTAAVIVTGTLNGLNAGATYHFRLTGSSVVGLVTGSDAVFTTLPAPSVVTGPVNSISGTTALLSGTINPNGQSAVYYFQSGTSAAYGAATSSQSAGNGNSAMNVTASLSGLNPNTTYHFRLTGSGSGVLVGGSDAMFATLPAPAVAVLATSNLQSSSATLNGTINPNGLATTYYIEFGPTSAYGSKTVVQSVGSGSSPAAVLLTLAGLTPGATYHFHIVAQNSDGTTVSNDTTVTMAALVDSDGDGIPDDYETANGLNPQNAADAALDADGDGMTNLQEYQAGTNPNDPASAFRIISAQPSGSDIVVTFTTVFAKSYRLEKSGDLTALSWATVADNIPGTGAPVVATDSGGAASAAPVFYRVRLLP